MDRLPPLPGTHLADWEDLALDFVAGKLAGPSLAAVEAHLASCVPCRAELERQKSAQALLVNQASLAEPPAGMFERVFFALDQELPPADDLAEAAGAGHPRPIRAGRTGEREPTLWHRLAGGFRRTRGAVWLPAAAAVLFVALALSQVDGLFSGRSAEESAETSAAATAASEDSADAQKQLAEQAPAGEGERSSGTTMAAGDGAEGGGSAPPAGETVGGDDDLEPQAEQVLLVERAPDANWRDGETTAERLAAVTGLAPLPRSSPSDEQVYVARTLRDDLPEVEARLTEAGFELQSEEAVAGEGPATRNADVLSQAREAGEQAPWLRPEEAGGLSALTSFGDEDRTLLGNDSLTLVLVVTE